MKKKIKMIALDLDGTTFTNDKRMTQHTKDVIQTAISQGIIVLPSTGRQFSDLPEESEEENQHSLTGNCPAGAVCLTKLISLTSNFPGVVLSFHKTIRAIVASGRMTVYFRHQNSPRRTRATTYRAAWHA